MKSNPLDRPAELDSPLPVQILLGLSGCFMVLIEGALGEWTVFYSSAPMVTLAFIFYMNLFYPSRLSILAVFVMGLFSELMFWQMLGVNATAYCMVALLTRWRASVLLHADFLEIWSAFSLLTFFVSSFELLAYVLFYFSAPDLTDIFLQAGMTILLFPVIYVLIMSAVSARLFFQASRVSR